MHTPKMLVDVDTIQPFLVLLFNPETDTDRD